MRVSGGRARRVAEGLLGAVPAARSATFASFRAADGATIDQGLALFFPAPHSYTGEDVLELQGHGGPVVMQLLLRRCLELGARFAQPGEFTRRAFLNDRIDLAQAESVADLDALLAQARQGAVLREGLTVVLVGRPNVGKSSLLNRLAGDEVAIVTPVAGTTRDYVRATIAVEGVPIHLIDTAGLRETSDEVERIGVERTWDAIRRAGAALFITEALAGTQAREGELIARLPPDIPVLHVENKADLAPPGMGQPGTLAVSAKTGQGIPALRQWLLETAGWKPHGEGLFMARGRHLEALAEARSHLLEAGANTQAFELMAESLRLAQASLGRITGAVSADDLLGEIFGRFCIGK